MLEIMPIVPSYVQCPVRRCCFVPADCVQLPMGSAEGAAERRNQRLEERKKNTASRLFGVTKISQSWLDFSGDPWESQMPSPLAPQGPCRLKKTKDDKLLIVFLTIVGEELA